ncbi:hypothetical protein HDK77DRAFT_62735 [Phyllosticta capitalensis]
MLPPKVADRVSTCVHYSLWRRGKWISLMKHMSGGNGAGGPFYRRPAPLHDDAEVAARVQAGSRLIPGLGRPEQTLFGLRAEQTERHFGFLRITTGAPHHPRTQRPSENEVVAHMASAAWQKKLMLACGHDRRLLSAFPRARPTSCSRKDGPVGPLRGGSRFSVADAGSLPQRRLSFRRVGWALLASTIFCWLPLRASTICRCPPALF